VAGIPRHRLLHQVGRYPTTLTAHTTCCTKWGVTHGRAGMGRASATLEGSASRVGSPVERVAHGAGPALGEAALAGVASAVERTRLQARISDHLIHAVEAGGIAESREQKERTRGDCS
jgi:hypothetical protein